MRRTASLFFLVGVGCAAGGRGTVPGAAPDAPESKTTSYERVLSSFATDPHEAVLIDPRTSVERLARPGGHAQLRWLVDRFHALDEHRAEAMTRVCHAAMLWQLGESRQAYEEITEAQALFGEVGDVEGLAHTHEWLGFMFLESGAVERAAEHLGAAYQLFGAFENVEAQERVLGYAD